MKAARFYAKNDVRVEELPKPTDLEPDEVLVRIRFCGICGTDLHEYADGPHFISAQPNSFSGASLPQILGHEFSGEIEAVGGDVKHLQRGDRVAIQPHMGPTDGYFGVRGLHFLGTRGAATGLTWNWGGFAHYAVMKSYAAVKLPDSVTFEQAAMVEPAAVAVTAVDRSGLRTRRLHPGDRGWTDRGLDGDGRGRRRRRQDLSQRTESGSQGTYRVLGTSSDDNRPRRSPA